MDIHRCRFVSYPTSTINVLAFSHSHISKPQKTAPLRLALGRANGDIEIWNPLKGGWFQETIIRGGKDRSVDGLVWTQDPNEDVDGRIFIGRSRLFSIGYTTTVTEWDIEKGRPLRQTSGNHGEIWCLAAQPALEAEENGKATIQWGGQNLLTGCTDGALVLYSTQDGDLQLQRVLVRASAKRAKIISVVFQNRNVVVAGCTDSTIRVYDIRSGVMLRNMSLGSGIPGRPKEIIVWSVKTLRNGNIVSGDSTGELRIWDGRTYTLVQRIKSHRQDVLSVATSHDGSTIFSGGMDRRTVVYKQVGKGKPRFAEVAHRRYHSHDVKTMATFEGCRMSIVVSGGPDGSPVVLPLKQFGMENQRALPFVPQEPPLISSPQQRLLVSYWDQEIHLWRLVKPPHPSTDAEEDHPNVAAHNRKLVAKILVKGDESIQSASLSSDGSMLAASTATDIKVFRLQTRGNLQGETLKVSKLAVPRGISTGARLIQFSPNGKWLCIIRNDNRIQLARIFYSDATPLLRKECTRLERIDRKVEKRILLGGLGAYDRNIMKVAFSSDSRILVVADLAGYIDTFLLSGHEDLTQIPPDDSPDSASSSDSSSDSGDESGDGDEKICLIFGQHWTHNPTATSLPKLPSTPIVVSFRPATKPTKAIANGIGPHPTRQNPHPVSKSLPTNETTEDRLLVVTATADVFEFDVLKGSLNAWSRRNPTSRFPDEFRKIRDQARGCVWDVSEVKERVWIYGIGWLWMFDLSRDFPALSTTTRVDGGDIAITNGRSVETSVSRKRKRHGKEGASGAGSSIPDELLDVGISRTMKRVIHEEVKEILPLVMGVESGDAMQLDDDDEDDDDEDGSDGRVTLSDAPRVQRQIMGEHVNGNATGEAIDEAVRTHSKDGDAAADRKESANGDNALNPLGEDSYLVDEETQPLHYWHTYKYRPILGIVPIGPVTELGPEVAIVERPLWDADLPPRYYGDQEWVKRDLGFAEGRNEGR